MSNKMLPKQTDFEDRLPTADAVTSFGLKGVGTSDFPAVQSDLASIMGGTTLNPSEGTLSPWKDAVNPTFTAADGITIDQSSGINDLAAAGTPVRYSSDGVAWKYGIITAVVVQTSTLDLTIAGVAMTAPTVVHFQVGSPEQVTARQIVIPGDLIQDNDQVATILKTEILWPFSEAFLVYASAKVNTAGSGADVQVAVARGAVGNDITSSNINLGQLADRVDSGTNINEANYKISFLEKLFLKVLTIGTTTPGSDLTIFLIAVMNTYQFSEFVPIAAEVPPFAFQMAGSTDNSSFSGTRTNSIEYFSMAVGVGNGADRGDDTETRSHACAMFDSTRTFNIGGQTPTKVPTISFIETPNITGNGVDRDDLPTSLDHLVGVSGPIYGNTMGGIFANGNETDTINYMLLASATGAAFDRNDLPQARAYGSGGFGSQIGLHSGGINASNFFQTDIYGLNLTTNEGAGFDRGDLLLANGKHACISDTDNETVVMCGGTTSTSTIGIGSDNTVQSTDLTLGTHNAADRADLNRDTGNAAGNSGETVGYISGGGGNSTVIGQIDKFDYTTGTITIANRGDMQVPKHSTGGDM